MYQSEEYYDEIDRYGQGELPEKHKATLTHELLGGTAAAGAVKLYLDKQKREGKEDQHALAKEALAGIAGAAIDRWVESHGLNEIDKVKAKHHAEQEAYKLYRDKTGHDVDQ